MMMKCTENIVRSVRTISSTYDCHCSGKFVDEEPNTLLVILFDFSNSASVFRSNRHERTNPNMFLKLRRIQRKYISVSVLERKDLIFEFS